MAENKVLFGTAGEEVTVTLPGGGGTGYVWKPLDIPADTKIRKEFSPPTGFGGMGSEAVKLTFQAPGEHQVTLGFTSPSQEVERTETFTFKIK
ncbi:MAG: protease inhibitor I42 family protein [Beijerinckiaceae bacterium]|jgi:hypothetical protein|nr:protease inhibitor I42 family protein [Beijerinckiaceae bacterium]